MGLSRLVASFPSAAWRVDPSVGQGRGTLGGMGREEGVWGTEEEVRQDQLPKGMRRCH